MYKSIAWHRSEDIHGNNNMTTLILYTRYNIPVTYHQPHDMFGNKNVTTKTHYDFGTMQLHNACNVSPALSSPG